MSIMQGIRLYLHFIWVNGELESATTEGVKEAMWLKGLIGELGLVKNKVEVFVIIKVSYI